jgi:hypothetical protein
MVYLDIEKYKKWAEHRRKSLNLRWIYYFNHFKEEPRNG